ncbi:MAG: hypothetical protein NVV73_00560 [Cellvibrionaceae bacterium]|nr:hypothetical protein [Cellvibrionaceae bacterium]
MQLVLEGKNIVIRTDESAGGASESADIKHYHKRIITSYFRCIDSFKITLANLTNPAREIAEKKGGEIARCKPRIPSFRKA